MRVARIFFVASALFALSGLAGASPARADEPSEESAPFAGRPPASGSFAPVAVGGGGFGTIGQWVVTVQTANDASTSLYLHAQSGGSTINLHPAVDTFLTSHISVGGVVGFNSGAGNTTVSLGARAGYDLDIVDRVGFWPTAGVFGFYESGNHMSQSGASLGIFAPFLYHPAPHFFLGIGPSFNLPLSGGGGNEFGLDFVIGGWL